MTQAKRHRNASEEETMEWTHSICEKCWNAKRPDRLAVPREGSKEECCFCGGHHQSGIYMRESSLGLACKGKLGIHKGAA